MDVVQPPIVGQDGGVDEEQCYSLAACLRPEPSTDLELHER